MLEAIEQDVFVDLVRVDAHVRMAAFAHNLGDAREILGREHAAGRVRGRAQDDEPRALREARREIVRREREPPCLGEMERHRARPHERRPRLVDREPRTRVDDLVAAIHVRLEGEPDRGLGPGRDDDPVGLHRDAPRRRHVAGDRLAEGGEPRRIAVAGVARLQLGHGDPIQVGRAAEVRRPDVEADDIHPPVETHLDVVVDLEGVLGPQIGEALR